MPLKISSLSVMAWPKKAISACNLACPFCISQMTHKVSAPQKMVPLNRIAFIAKQFRRLADGIPYGIITGKGEPTLASKEKLGKLIATLYDAGLVPELQTNGTELNSDNLAYWKKQGLNTVAISCVSHLDEVNSQLLSNPKRIVHWQMGRAVEEAVKLGLLVRLTVTLTQGGVDSQKTTVDFLRWAEEHGAHQVTFRQMGVPRNLSLPGSREVAQWIRQHHVEPDIVLNTLRNNSFAMEKEALPWAYRFGYNGMSVLVTDCLTAPQKEKARHGVIQPDGHLYLSWDDASDIVI